MITARPIAYLLLSLFVAGAQDPGANAVRERVLGEVHGRDGKPWVGATVTLVGDTALSQLGLEAADRIEVKTGARGRFRARLLPDRSYAAWAVLESEGVRRVTERATVVPGDAVELVEDATQPVAVTVEVFGFDAWTQHGMRLFVDSHELALDGEGRAKLPALAGDSTAVEGRIGARVLFRHVVWLERDRRQQPAKPVPNALDPVPLLPDLTKLPPPAVDVERILVPPPLEVTVLVVDKASKKPIPGAGVLTRDERSTGEVFETGKDGRARFVIAHPIDSLGQHRKGKRHEFLAFAKGYSLRRTGWRTTSRAPALTRERITDGKAEELTAELEPGFRVKGKVLPPEGLDPSALRVLYEMRTTESAGVNSYTTIRVGSHAAPVAADGTWTVLGLGKRHSSVEAQLVLPPALTSGLVKDRTPMPATTRLPIPLPNAYELGNDIDVTVDLRKLRAIDLTLELEDGPKVGYAEVALMPSKSGSNGEPKIAEHVRSDRRGRCRVFVNDKDTVIVATTKTHYAMVKPGNEAEQKITLKRCARFTGRVVDKNNKPIAGVSIHLRSITFAGGDPLDSLRMVWNQRSLSGKTDKDGRFSLSWIPSQAVTIEVQAYLSGARSGGVVLGMESVEDTTLTLDIDTKAKAKGK